MNSKFGICLLFLLFLVHSNDLVLSNEFFTNYFTDNDFNTWTMSGNNIPADHFFTQCGSQRIFGGYKKFTGDPTLPIKISRQYTNLIAHYAIRVQAKIYKIDSWNNESAFVMIDNVAHKLYTFDQTNSTTNICGDPYPSIDAINTNFNDSIIIVDLNITHTGMTLDVGFQTNLNSDRGWWGVRDIKITLMLCDKSCKSCTNSSACSTCESAITGLTLVGAYCECTIAGQIKELITNCATMPCVRCVASCSGGYYNSAVTGKCEPCHPACMSCSVASNTVSPACNPCSVGYFRANPLAQPCYNCLGGCSSCTALTNTACTACKEGYFYYANQCLTSCPNGTYSQERLRQCVVCSGSCFTCDGMTSFHCTSCTGPLYLTPTNQCLASCNPPYFKFNNTCFQECSSGTFEDPVLLTCASCPTNCNQCANSTSCSKCGSGFYLIAGACQSSCPSTHYASTTLGECLLCHSDCLQCIGASSTSCKVCSDASKILLNGACYGTCPNGTYSALCLSCHSTCLSCTGPLQTDCVSCPSLRFLDLTTYKCLQTCDVGAIVDKTNQTCKKCPSTMVGYFNECVPCHPTCSTCYSTNFMQCLSCEPGQQLYQSTCIHLNDQSQHIIKSKANQLRTTSTIITFLVMTGFTCVILEVFFTYKTALLPTIQFIQILSYFLFFSLPMSESVQSILQFLYLTNFTVFLRVDSGQMAKDMPLKISLMNKTGFYAIDTFGIHIVMVVAALILVLLKKIRSLSRVLEYFHSVFNPYLLSYLYRLVILDQFFSLIIYLRYGEIDTALGIASMVVLIIDVLILGLTLFWKIKPSNLEKKQYALFYFNQIQIKYEADNNYAYQNQQHNSNNTKSALLSLVFYIGKVPFPLAIVYFIQNGTYQSIAICCYSAFFLLLLLIMPYKRKIYKFLYFLGAALLLISSAILIGVNQTQNLSVALQVIWLVYIVLILTITLAQLAINYQLFIYFIKYLIHRTQTFFAQKHDQFDSSEISEQIHSQNERKSESTQNIDKQNNDFQCENQQALIKQESIQIKQDSLKQGEIHSNKQEIQSLNQSQNFTDLKNPKQNEKQKSTKENKRAEIPMDQSLYSKWDLELKKNDKKHSDSDQVELDFDL